MVTHTDSKPATSYGHTADAATPTLNELQESCYLAIESVECIDEEHGRPGQIIFSRKFKARQYFQRITSYMEANFDLFIDYEFDRDNVLRVYPRNHIEGWMPDEHWRAITTYRWSELISCINDWIHKARRTVGHWPEFARYMQNWRLEANEAMFRRIQANIGAGGLPLILPPQHQASY